MIRNQAVSIHRVILIHIFHCSSNSDVDMYPKDNAVMVKVNGVEIPINNLPYLHPTGCLSLRHDHNVS